MNCNKKWLAWNKYCSNFISFQDNLWWAQELLDAQSDNRSVKALRLQVEALQSKNVASTSQPDNSHLLQLEKTVSDLREELHTLKSQQLESNNEPAQEDNIVSELQETVRNLRAQLELIASEASNSKNTTSEESVLIFGRDYHLV